MGIFPRGIVRINGKPVLCADIGIDVYMSDNGPKRFYTIRLATGQGADRIVRNSHLEMAMYSDDFSMEEVWGIYRVMEIRKDVDQYEREDWSLSLMEVMSDTQSIFQDVGTNDRGPTFDPA